MVVTYFRIFYKINIIIESNLRYHLSEYNLFFQYIVLFDTFSKKHQINICSNKLSFRKQRILR